MGRVFMPTVDDPFRVAREMVDMLRDQTHVIVVDVHAEATSEKMALGALPRRLGLVRLRFAHARPNGRRTDPRRRHRLHYRRRDDRVRPTA